MLREFHTTFLSIKVSIRVLPLFVAFNFGFLFVLFAYEATLAQEANFDQEATLAQDATSDQRSIKLPPQSVLVNSITMEGLSIQAFSVQPSQLFYYSKLGWQVIIGGVHLVNPGIYPNKQAYPTFENWLNDFSNDHSNGKVVTNESTDWVNRLFQRNAGESSFQKRIKYDLLNIHVQNDQLSFGLFADYRSLQQFSFGRSWFESTWIPDGNEFIQNQNLGHKGANFLNLGFNYSEKWDVLTDYTPRSDVLSIGFSPRIILAGDLQLSSTTRILDKSTNQINSSTNMTLSGITQNALYSLLAEQSFEQIRISDNPLLPVAIDDFKQGLGYGIDFGISYLLNLGNETSLETDLSTPLKKVIALALSISDIGYIHYADASEAVIPTMESVFIGSDLIPFISTEQLPVYSGKALEFLRYIDKLGVLDQIGPNELSNQSMDVLLPTKADFGMMLIWNKWRLQAGIEYSFFDTIGSLPSWTYEGQLAIEPLRNVMISSGYKSSTVWADEFQLGVGVQLNKFQLGVVSHISPSHGSGDLLPQSYSFSGISIIR